MSKGFWRKLKYYHIELDEKLAKWAERRAHKNFKEAEADIVRFKDMACFGCSKTGPWECGCFHKDFICQHETCPVQKLNEAYVIASYSLRRARMCLSQTNSYANAMREDMGIRKVR